MQTEVAGKVSLQGAVEQFIFDRKCRGRRPDSLAWYEEKLGKFMTWLTSTYPGAGVESITTGTVRKFIAHEQQRGRSAGGINCCLRAVKGLTRFLVEEQILDQKPMVKLLTTEELIPRILTDDEIRRLVKAPDVSTFAGVRDRGLMLLMLDVGLRAGEIGRAKIKDLDLPNASIVVLGKTRRERKLYFSRSTAKALLAYWKRRSKIRPCRDDDLLFITQSGSPLTGRRLYHALAAYGKKCRIPGSVSPHCWRRSCATRLAQQGVNLFQLMTLLGHRQVTTTQRYVSVSDDDLRQMQERYGVVEQVLR